MVVDPVSAKLGYRWKNTAVSAIRTAYPDFGLKRDTNFLEHYTLQAQHYRENFDFVVANGKAVQLAQTWSFQIPNQRDLVEARNAFGSGMLAT